MSAIEVIKQHASHIEARYGVARIGVFGSHARGEQGARSDVDILVEFKQGQKTFDNFMELKAYLEGALGAPVDLVTPKALKPQIKESVLLETLYA